MRFDLYFKTEALRQRLEQFWHRRFYARLTQRAGGL
jgi:hypothetical protein